MNLLSKRLAKRFKLKTKESVASTYGSLDYISPYGGYHGGPSLIMCDAFGDGTCHGGTMQDETCLTCDCYVKGSSPRVEAFRK